LERVTGVDLTLELLSGKCPQAQIYLLGGAPGVAEAVKIKYARENIVSAEDGGKLLGNNNELENNQAILDRINNSGANILLVAFGQIKQEMWLAENLPKLPNIKIAIGVGGTFDYLSGRAKRPPQWLRNLGLEWLYRLIKEPKRWKRIWNATAVFSWLVFRKKYHF
jgi:N-acetylglucosaminyldiphosphoundecaprenol N-acetyl-beta-D-mannosaminyltransferase